MGLSKNLLQQDHLHKATRESVCIVSCLHTLRSAYKNSDFKTAQTMTENISRSVNELKKLNDEIEKQLQQDLIKSLI